MTLWKTRKVLTDHGFSEVRGADASNPFGWVPERADVDAGFVLFRKGPLEIVFFKETDGGSKDYLLIGFPHVGWCWFIWEHNDPNVFIDQLWCKLPDSKIMVQSEEWTKWVQRRGVRSSVHWVNVGCLDFAVEVFLRHPLMIGS